MSQQVKEFIHSLTLKEYDKLRSSSSNAESRRVLLGKLSKNEYFYCNNKKYSGKKCEEVCQECKGIKNPEDIVEEFMKKKLPFTNSLGDEDKGSLMTNLVTFYEWAKENMYI